MTRMKTIAGAAAAATVLLAASGCSAGGGGDAEGGSITWWATQQTATIGDSEAAYQEAIDRFTEETGIEVEFEVIPWADLYNRILTAVSSGTGPDVLNIGTTWTGSLHDTGALAPIEGDALDWLGGSERFVPAVYEAAQVPGETQDAVPFLSNVYSLYYNPALFEAAGIAEPPATWEEFVEVGQQLTVDTDGDGAIDQWGYSGAAANVQQNAHMAFILGQQHGGDFVDDEGAATLDSEGQVAGVEAYVGLMTDSQIMAPSNSEIDLGADAVDQFINGDAAMILQQNPIEQFTSRDFTDWAIAPTPVLSDGEDVESMIAGTNITVLVDSPNQEQAFEFVEHMTSVEEQAELSSAFGLLPVVTDAYDEPQLADSGDTTLEVRRDAQANASAPFPLVGNIGEIEAAVGNALRESFQAFATGGDADVASRLAAANGEVR